MSLDFADAARLEAIEKMAASLDKKIDNLARGLALLCRHLGAMPGQATAPTATAAIADDADLDGQWGDEEIKKDPPRWKGDPQAPCRMSACPPDYLDAFAEFKDFCAAKDDEAAGTLDGEEATKKRKYAGYGRKSAARARGWARRLRAQEI